MFLSFLAFRQPTAPYTGLDASWKLGITEAYLDSLVFGREFVFTYGPLGYLEAGIATPQSFPQFFVFSILVASMCAALGTYLLLIQHSLTQRVAIFFALAVSLSIRTFNSLTLFILIMCWMLPMFRQPLRKPTAAILLGLVSGCLALIKFNIAIAAGFGGLALFGLGAILTQPDNRRSYCMSIVAFISGFAAVYCWPSAAVDYGALMSSSLALSAVALNAITADAQRGHMLRLAALVPALVLFCSPTLWAFLSSSAQIASGYSSAMSIEGPLWQLALAAVSSALLIAVIVRNISEIKLEVALALGVALFIAFKEGFVRQDIHAAFFFWAILVMSVAAAGFCQRNKNSALKIACILVALFSLEIIDRSEGINDSLGPGLLWAVPLGDVLQSTNYLLNPSAINAALRNGLAPDLISERARSEIGTDSIEALPWESNVIFSNQLAWHPDPVFQSYFAFTPPLDKLNAAHLKKDGASHILYEWAAIDGRQALWDQPYANREMICRYHPDEREPDPLTTMGEQQMLLLKRGSDRCGSLTVLTRRTVSWNQELSVNAGTGLTYARISIKYSALGLLTKTLFRLPPVYITIGRGSHERLTFRLLSETASDGVLLDPLPLNIRDLRSLLRGKTDGAGVRSLFITTGAPYLFEPTITVDTESETYS